MKAGAAVQQNRQALKLEVGEAGGCVGIVKGRSVRVSEGCSPMQRAALRLDVGGEVQGVGYSVGRLC